MLAVNDRIKNAYNQYTTQRKSKIRVGNNEYFIQNMDLYADAYDEGNIVGNTIAKILKFNIETQYVRGLDEFELLDGIWTGEEYEYINLGTFKLFEEQGADDFFSSITAYDKLILFNEVYNPELTIYPTTVYGLLENICQQAGVTLATSSIANGSKVLNENIFVEGETLKDILKAICQISGNFAIISNDTLKLKLQGTDNITLSKYQLNKPEYKRTTWKVNQVVLGMQNIAGEYVLKQDDEDVELNGVHKIVINNNPFVYTQDLRQEYIDELFDVLKGFGYVAFQTNWEGLPYAELGDLLTIDGYNSMILRYEIKSPDGLNSILQAPSIIDSIIDYVDNTNDIEKRQSRTEYTVDKHNQQIQALITSVEENSEKIDGLEPTQEATGIEELYLPNSAGKDLIEYRLKGKSEQDSYTGKNLFNNAYGQTSNVYTININANNPLGSVNCYPINLLPNTQYTLKVDMNGYQKTNAWIAGICFANGDVISLLQLGSIEDITTTTFTTDSTGVVYVGHRYGFTYGTTGRMDLFLQTAKIQIEKGSTSTDFEKYVGGTPSPNPNYPQDIKSIGDIRNIYQGFSLSNSNNGIDYEYNEDGSITADGTATATSYSMTASQATSYLIKLQAGTYIISGGKNAVRIDVVNSSGTTLASSNSTSTFTLNAETQCFVRLRVENGTVLNNIKFYPMLEKGDILNEYVPHGNYIDVVNGSKNLFNSELNANSIGGVNVTYNEQDGTITLNGTATETTSLYIFENYPSGEPKIQLIKNEKYTASASVISGTYSPVSGQSENSSIQFWRKWDYSFYLAFSQIENAKVHHTRTLDSNVKLNAFQLKVVQGDVFNNFTIGIQFEKGDFTLFEKYEKNHNYINLTQPLPSLPDGTADELIIKDGHAKIIQNVYRVVLDGSEDGWSKNNYAFENTSIFTGKPTSICSHFTNAGSNWTSSNEEYRGKYTTTNANDRFKCMPLVDMRIADFKTWLSNNNVLLQYALAEPIEIDLGEVSIKTINGNDYLYITDPIKSDMYTKYIRNTTLNDVYYTKIETDTQINIAKDSITSSVSETYETKLDSTNSINNAKNEAISRANSYSDDVLNTARTESIQYTNQKVTEEITATSERITVVEETIRDGVSVVRTETGYTFDADGLKIAKEGQEMNSLLDNDGLAVKRNTDEVLTVRSEGVNAENITVRNYFKLDPVRFEKISSTTDSTQDGLGIFYTGGDI